jgi:hypothetical protein
MEAIVPSAHASQQQSTTASPSLQPFHWRKASMSAEKLNRRQLVALAAGAAAVGTTMASTSTEAYQGNMERALSSLFNALASLREATSNKGGHRVKAMALVQQAIEQTQAGVEFANEHSGGGAP